jgi:sulfur relay (sulfurtransferase) complex TusBCD TusD component (DsrE family)
MAKMLFIISKGFDQAGAATRALQFASIAVDKGHKVEIFLIDDAVPFAVAGMAKGIHTTTGEPMQDFIDKLVKAKVTVHVCKPCADKRLISPDDLIPTGKFSVGSDLVELMADPESKVITF